jgi:heme/copper-type cytochrome/quinol oxidase subunit 4
MQSDAGKPDSRLKTGWVVAAILTVLTIGEYIVAVEVTNNLIWLVLFAIAKSWLILKYFMHIQHLWNEGGHH